MYAASQLPAAELTRLTFEWAYPDLAPLYRERGESYPALGERGELLVDTHAQKT